MITREEAAAKLDGNQYREEGSKELWKAMKEAGLVAVFGESDDLMEMEGAIHDQFGVYGGNFAYLTSRGLFESDCDNDDCPYARRMKTKTQKIEALWAPEGIEGNPSWAYATDIPHSTFKIMEDGELYCIGIVFALSDVVSP